MEISFELFSDFSIWFEMVMNYTIHTCLRHQRCPAKGNKSTVIVIVCVTQRTSWIYSVSGSTFVYTKWTAVLCVLTAEVDSGQE